MAESFMESSDTDPEWRGQVPHCRRKNCQVWPLVVAGEYKYHNNTEARLCWEATETEPCPVLYRRLVKAYEKSERLNKKRAQWIREEIERRANGIPELQQDKLQALDRIVDELELGPMGPCPDPDEVKND